MTNLQEDMVGSLDLLDLVKVLLYGDQNQSPLLLLHLRIQSIVFLPVEWEVFVELKSGQSVRFCLYKWNFYLPTILYSSLMVNSQGYVWLF